MKILIVKTSSLGDIVHTFPALELLRKHYPEAEIHWVVEQPFAALLEANPLVDFVIPINTKEWRKNIFSWKTIAEIKETFANLRKPYDLLFDLQGNTKSAIVTGLAKAKVKVGYGLKTVWEYPNLLFTHVKYDPPLSVNVRDENLFLVQNYLQTNESAPGQIILKLKDCEKTYLTQFLQQDILQDKQKIFVAPGSNWKNKQVDEKAITEFLQLIQHSTCFVIVYSNEQEQLMASRIASGLSSAIVVGKLSLPLLQNLMANMDLVIAMDSLPLHLAASAGTPTFSIFGPSAASKFAPRGKEHFFIQGACPYGKIFSRRCDILRSCKSGACVKNLNSNDLLEAWLKKN